MRSEGRVFNPRVERLLACALLGMAAMLWISRGVLALSGPVGVDDIPGMGVWGYKALAIADSGQIPWSLLCDRERPYLNPSYPLGYPLLLAWGHWFAGGVDDHAVKLLPCLSGLLVFLMLAVMLCESGFPLWIALVLGLAPCCGDVFGYCLEALYAETTLLLFLLPGVWLVQRNLRERAAPDLWLGVLLLGMAAWVKQEGMFFLVLVLSWLVVDGWRRRNGRGLAGASAAAAALFVMPWAWCRWKTGVSLSDFSLIQPWKAGIHETLCVLGMGWRKGLCGMFLALKENGGLWVVAAALLAGGLARSPRQGNGIGFAWYAALVPPAFFMSLYVFSVRELEWHMDASLPRLLLVSGMCALALGAGAFAPDDAAASPGGRW